MLARLQVCLLVSLLLLPGALAFAASRDEVSLQYDASKAPILLASGKLEATGALRGGLLAAGLETSVVGPIPRLTLIETVNNTPSLTNVSDATVTFHKGALAWKIDNGSATLTAVAPYGFGLALPQSPFDFEGTGRSPAIVMAGPVLFTDISWISGDVSLIPMDATVTIRDGAGTLVWDHRAVNARASIHSIGGEGGAAVLLRANGAFDAKLVGQALVGGLGSSAQQMRIDVRAADEDRFVETVQAIGNATALMGSNSNGQGGGENPLGGGLPDQLQALSPVFNGAVLVLPGGGGDTRGENASAPPLESRIGGNDVDVGGFAMLRSQDLALAWGDGRVGVQGTSAMTVTKDGFSTPSPLTLGPLPLISVLLWMGALTAIVIFLVKRPPKSEGAWSMRIVSFLVWLVVFAAVFWWWDRSFAQTFGTSLISMIKAHGISSQSYSQLGLLFGIEMIPWGVAALLFALPVRIILGVLLRYRGQGSSFKRVAAAGGLISLAIFGPLYALWIVNVMIKEIVQYAPRLFG